MLKLRKEKNMQKKMDFHFMKHQRYSGMGTEHAAFLGVGFNAGARAVAVE